MRIDDLLLTIGGHLGGGGRPAGRHIKSLRAFASLAVAMRIIFEYIETSRFRSIVFFRMCLSSFLACVMLSFLVCVMCSF